MINVQQATPEQLAQALAIVTQDMVNQQALEEDSRDRNLLGAATQAVGMLTEWIAMKVEIRSHMEGFWILPSQGTTRVYVCTGTSCTCDFGQHHQADDGRICKHMLIADVLTDILGATVDEQGNTVPRETPDVPPEILVKEQAHWHRQQALRGDSPDTDGWDLTERQRTKHKEDIPF